MRNPRARRLLLALIVLGGCAGGDGAVTGPARQRSTPEARLSLQRIDAQGSDDQPIDRWMGAASTEPIRVRVVDTHGRPVSRARVRFSTERDALGALIGNDSATTVESDDHGIATLANWTTPVRDTVSTRHTVVARVEGADSAEVRFVARAWRDLGSFGGTTPLSLDALPIDRAALSDILPLGTFGRGDALPSADALLLPRSGRTHAVRAMSSGLIIDVDADAGAITMRVRNEVRVRMGGFTLRPDLWVGRRVRVGDTLGELDASRTGAALAVRVMDAAVQRTNWVRADRYGARRNAAFFARYLADSVRSAAYALVRRASPDLDGRIDYDRDGRLIGTWFDPTSPAVTSAHPAELESRSQFSALRASELDPSSRLAPVALTFAYDAERPGQVRIASGSALADALGVRGVHAVAWEDRDPADVGVIDGLVRYRLFATDDGNRTGQVERVLLVQLVDDATLRVELVPARNADTARFSSRAVILVR